MIAMGKKEHKRHHYIPQCYLRNFSLDGHSLWTYDKVKSEKYTYPSAIDNICCIEEFYTLPIGCVNMYDEERKNQLFIECDFFAENIESQYCSMLQKIISNKEMWIDNPEQLAITKEEKKEFASYITIQWLRTPYQRDKIKNFDDDVIPQMIRILQQGLAIEQNNPEIAKLKIDYQIDPVIEHASMTFMNDELVAKYSNALLSGFWEFSVSSKNDIYTSDCPIVVESHVKNVRPICEGLASYGSEVSFPISKNIILTIWDREYFTDKSELDCKFVFLDEKEKRRKNWFRYFYAKRQLFSHDNQFDYLELAKFSNGGIHIFKGK